MMRVLGRVTSINVRKVLWALDELGIGYEREDWGLPIRDPKVPEFLALNPNGLVPTLRDGNLVLWESHAIVRYLAARYSPGRLWLEDPVVRAECDRWTDWTATTFQPAWIDVFWKHYRTAPEKRDRDAVAKAVAGTTACLEIMNGQLERTRFLAGDHLTYADIVAGTAMYRLTTMGIDIPIPGNVGRWHDELRGRAAYRLGVEVDYSELAGRSSA